MPSDVRVSNARRERTDEEKQWNQRLFNAARDGNYHQVAECLEPGRAHINAKDEDGNTALALAVYAGSNIPDENTYTQGHAHYTIKPDRAKDYYNVIEKLLYHGANQFIKNDRGRMPFDAADTFVSVMQNGSPARIIRGTLTKHNAVIHNAIVQTIDAACEHPELSAYFKRERLEFKKSVRKFVFAELTKLDEKNAKQMHALDHDVSRHFVYAALDHLREHDSLHALTPQTVLNKIDNVALSFGDANDHATALRQENLKKVAIIDSTKNMGSYRLHIKFGSKMIRKAVADENQALFSQLENAGAIVNQHVGGLHKKGYSIDIYVPHYMKDIMEPMKTQLTAIMAEKNRASGLDHSPHLHS